MDEAPAEAATGSGASHTGRKPNRLARETSPYLLQHAYNPVDWYPWGDEAFEEARRRDAPILLSIGYAACHWCHVMERESFEDDETARLMNERFVPVKVDREERPDVDSIYMDAVQALTNHGGWPMTVFCTPDGIPFLGGTYFPPEDRQGLPGFKRVLAHVSELWGSRREDLLRQGTEVMQRLAAMASPPPVDEPLTDALLTGAAREIVAVHDPVYGGFGRAPKFPQAPVLELLLRLDHRGTASLAEPVERTLTRMAQGGIYDHLGGGFARYSVDERWLVPHFEKMLYDNAQLARVYVHAFQAYGKPLYERIARETLEYVLRDMRHEDGGLFSSEDADSEGEEGKFYLWDYDEVEAIAPEALDYYGVTREGNFEGRNILTAESAEDPPPEPRAKLLQARSGRVRPGRDDKVLASWNGLAIAAFAEAGAALGRDEFVDAARRAADFVLVAMADPAGRLRHSWREGRAHVTGMLEDYAYMADGLLELWQATFEQRWLDACTRLVDEALELFGDASAGGFYSTGSDHDRLIVRQKEVIESATPSPGAVLGLVLQRLAVLLERPEYARAAVGALRVAHVFMARAPQASATWLSGLDFYLSRPQEVALLGNLDTEAGRALLSEVTLRYLPNRVLAGAPAATDRIPLLRDRGPIDGRPTAYVCEGYACKAPTSEPAELARQLVASA